jgi:hypothetical protein
MPVTYTINKNDGTFTTGRRSCRLAAKRGVTCVEFTPRVLRWSEDDDREVVVTRRTSPRLAGYYAARDAKSRRTAESFRLIEEVLAFAAMKYGPRPTVCLDWYDNGQKMEEVPYVDGKRHGLYQKWYDNGQRWAEVTYIKGERHGMYRSWHRNGLKYEEVPWVNGKIHGVWTIWRDTGEKFRDIRVEHHVPV